MISALYHVFGLLLSDTIFGSCNNFLTLIMQVTQSPLHMYADARRLNKGMVSLFINTLLLCYIVLQLDILI